MYRAPVLGCPRVQHKHKQKKQAYALPTKKILSYIPNTTTKESTTTSLKDSTNTPTSTSQTVHKDSTYTTPKESIN